MSDQSLAGTAKMSTAGGFLTALFLNINAADIINTAVMAAVGAIVSFATSVLLKYCISHWRK